MGPKPPGLILMSGAHLNITVRGPFKLVRKIKLRGLDPSGSILFWGAHLNSPQFKWAPQNNIDPEGSSPLNLIGGYLNWGLFKWAPG